MKAIIKSNPLDSGPWLHWRYIVELRRPDRSLASIAYADDVLTASVIANAFNVPVEVEV